MIQLPLQFDSIQVSTTAPRGRARQVALADGVLTYAFIPARRRTMSIIVGRQGVEVRAPRWMPRAEVDAFIREKESWIRRRLHEYRRETRAFAWNEGECLPLFGRQVRLHLPRLAATPEERIILQEEDRLVAHLHVSDGIEQLRGAVLTWLRAASLALFHRRVDHFSRRLGVAAPAVRLSNALTQWGSCHASGRVLLNWRLVHVPERLIDYVVAHEIAHLREMNHSPRFWSLLESVYPGCRAARRELNLLEKQIPEL